MKAEVNYIWESSSGSKDKCKLVASFVVACHVHLSAPIFSRFTLLDGYESFPCSCDPSGLNETRTSREDYRFRDVAVNEDGIGWRESLGQGSAEGYFYNITIIALCNRESSWRSGCSQEAWIKKHFDFA